MTGRVGGGGAAMSGVIRGSGCVFGPLSRCQSFSASIRLPRSARSRNTPWHDEHWWTVTSPIVRGDIVDWHWGQVDSSVSDMARPYSGG